MGSVEPDARMKSPWDTLEVSTVMVMGGPARGAVVVTGAEVTTAGGRVTTTMVGVWVAGEGVFIFRMYGVIPMRAATIVPMVAMSWTQGKALFFSSSGISGFLEEMRFSLSAHMFYGLLVPRAP
jgi:hypothetical protein